MKKKFYLFLFVPLFLLSLIPVPSTAQNPPDIEQIVVTGKNGTGHERGGPTLVEAFLFRSMCTIYIALAYEVGTAMITVSDAGGVTVYSDIVDATQIGFTQFAAPTASGTYNLEVQSSSYYGRGQFVIE